MARVVRPFVWRSVPFRVTERSRHSGYVCFESAGSVWKVERFRQRHTWYARLRLGCHRMSGQGSSLRNALEAALAASLELFHQLRGALPPGLSPELSASLDVVPREPPSLEV